LFVQIAPTFFDPSPDRVGPRFVGLAAVFYGALFLAAVVLSALRDRDISVLGSSVFLDLSVGGAVACGTVTLGVFLYRLLPAVQKLSNELAPRLVDGAGRGDLVLVAVFSGVGEEAFFRGALQPELGIVATSVLFGALHVGPDRRYLLWTLWAVGAGFLFGFLYERTGGLLAPATAHVLHNAAMLLLWKRSRRKRFRTLEGAPREGTAARREG
jgi:membrane protease YdiL (CAAX protease family)